MSDTVSSNSGSQSSLADVSQHSQHHGIAIALAILADATIFLAATAAGLSFCAAHIASFAAASALSYWLIIRPDLGARSRSRDLRLHANLIVVALLALFLRGGVLALVAHTWGAPKYIAIVFAIAATWAVTQPGYRFFLGDTSSHKLGAGARWQTLSIGLIIYAFVLRLVYLGQAELLPEEAYYWNYSRHPDIGYLDHPPMVAWLIGLGTAAFGTSEFAVRAGAVMCGAIASFFTFRLTRNLFDRPAALVALLLVQTLPFFFMAAMLMTPDTPLTAAWAGELFFLERALVARKSRAWLGVGIFLGIGLISKYTLGLLVPATLLFVVLDPPSRRWLVRWEPYAACLIGLLLFSPVIIWNAQNEWASFAFQTARRLSGRPDFSLHKLILAALVLITPTGLAAAANALARGRPGASVDPLVLEARRRWLFLQAVVGIPLAVYIVFSLRHMVKFDWTGALWLGALPAIAFAATTSEARVFRRLGARLRAAWWPTLAVVLILFGTGLHYLTLGLPGMGYGERIELAPVGWRDLSQQLGRIAQANLDPRGAEPLIVGMDRYQIASEVAFYAAAAKRSPITSAAHLFDAIGLMYERWIPIKQQVGRDLLLVAWDTADLSNSCIQSRSTRLGPIQDGLLTRDGQSIRAYHYRMAYGFKGAVTCG